MAEAGAGRAKRSVRRWFLARSEPERAAIISASAAVVAASLGVAGTLTAGALQAHRNATASGDGPHAVAVPTPRDNLASEPARGNDSVRNPSPEDHAAARNRGRSLKISNGYSIDLDSGAPNLGLTANDDAPGVDVTVRLGWPALELAPDAVAASAEDGSDLAFCQATTDRIGIDGTTMAAGKSFCVGTGKGAWVWLKIVRIENNGAPGQITLFIDKLSGT